jgi:alpha-galactosidase
MAQFAQVEQDAPHRYPFTPPPVMRYPIMGEALNRTGRNISYMCNFPWQFWHMQEDPAMGGRWVSEVCNSWRTAGDPQPGFSQALGYVRGTEKYADLVPSGPGGWHTLDAIEIGNSNSWDALPPSGAAVEADGATGGMAGALRALRSGGGAMTAAQEQAVMSLYVLIKTPLFIGTDVTRLTGHSLDAYLNHDLITKVHQDPLGAQGRRIRSDGADVEVWACALSGGRAAAVLLNGAGAGGTAVDIGVSWKELPLPAADDPAAKREVFNVWSHNVTGSFGGRFEAKAVPPGSAVVIVVGAAVAAV